jgi:alpha-L-fucosidase
MSLSRRDALKLLAASAPLLASARSLAATAEAASLPAIAPGPFKGTRASLLAYEIPQWYADAKFGIWAHWGPQSAPEYGDWYARNLYIDKTDQYKQHRETYGHPTKFGYKDIVPLWTGANFDADHLVGLYKQAGAKYFMSLGVHCDNVDLWDSKHQPRWNSVNMGPKKNIVRLFRDAARKHDLRFGVSDHLWPSPKWLSVCRGSDTKGELAGVPYDAVNANADDLYPPYPYPDRKLDWDETNLTEAWKKHYFARIKDLLDQFEPDVVYCDGHIPFEEYGLGLVAHLYNLSARKNGGIADAIYTSKRPEDAEHSECVLDFERAVPDKIWPRPWQICTCVGGWHYDRRKLGGGYKTPKRVIDMLVDTVSRNGNLLLNFPLRNDGTLDSEELAILAGITAWMKTNGEGIYATRPWKIFGDGPRSHIKNDPKVKYNESLRQDFDEQDVRFTKKGDDLFAFVTGVPAREAVIPSLARSQAHVTGRIERVTLLGHGEPLKFTHDDSSLRIELPETKPSHHVLAFKINGLA